MKIDHLFHFCLVIFLGGILAGILWFMLPKSERQNAAVSPVPAFLTLRENSQVRFMDLWTPIMQYIPGTGNDDVPSLTAKSVLMYDLSTNKAIFEKSPRQRLPMASLTKIMTAIVSLENRREDDTYIVSEANRVGEDSMGLIVGDKLSLEELLYGLMLPSGNDAAEVLASNSPFGREGFINAMNKKAEALGLTDTRFSNPSGLQGDGIQYTTAYDLLVITRYALDNFPELAKIAATPEHSIPANSRHSAYNVTSEVNLLTTYPGVKGLKTGYTPEAGLCLVTYLDYDGHKIIGVLLNSENRRGEMKELLDYSLKSFGIEPPEYNGG